MNHFFRRLPLLAKLMLIGLVPFFFLVYLTVQVYNDKTDKLKLFDSYKIYMAESANIIGLMDALQDEWKFSFDYAMTRNMRQQVVLQRPHTDSLLQQLIQSKDPAIAGINSYTKLGGLQEMRSRIDRLEARPDAVIHFYSNTLFRLNTLNTIPPANTTYLQSAYSDLATQKILSEMLTYLSIIRSNIYSILYTKKYVTETLLGTVGTHDVYNSYQAELFAKADASIQEKYRLMKNTTALKPTTDYIDTLFKTFSLDSSYSAAGWWKVSDEGLDALRKFQVTIWNGLNEKVNALYDREESARNRSVFFLILALLSVLLIATYIVFIISRSLHKLRLAAEKIAAGETGMHVPVESNDVIGSLAGSILSIDKNNQALTLAATEIGKGNFAVDVRPRSAGDALGNAIIQMKKDLQQYSQKMEELVATRTEELARSNEDLQQFAHVASHDLKEPLRKITTFSNILSNEQKEGLSEKGKLYLQKIEQSSKRMSSMIEGVLAYSTVAAHEQPPETVDLNTILEEVENDLELAIIQKEAQLVYGKLPQVQGTKLLLHQLFYNLVNNALKFSKENVPPVISIVADAVKKSSVVNGSRKEGSFLKLTVSDNGIGFNQGYAERIFGVFSRLNAKDKYEGTGLGLALCKKIVHRHGGEIWAEGTEGEGAVFHIILPAG
jgi:signal transduction histidine kinase